MKKILNNPFLNLAVRLILGGLFIFASIGKISDSPLFAKEILNYNIMPDFTINLMAIVLPWIELIVGIFIIAGVRLKASAAILTFLSLIFLIAVSIALITGLNINCGCYSHLATEKIGLNKLFENIGYLVGSLYLFLFPVDRFTLDKYTQREILIEADLQ